MRFALRMVWMTLWTWGAGFEERERKEGVEGRGVLGSSGRRMVMAGAR